MHKILTALYRCNLFRPISHVSLEQQSIKQLHKTNDAAHYKNVSLNLYTLSTIYTKEMFAFLAQIGATQLFISLITRITIFIVTIIPN